MNISHISNNAPPAPAAAERKAGIDSQAASVAKAPSESADVVKDQPEQNPQQQLPEALKRINTVLQIRSPDLEFSIDDSARTIVKVIDTTTQEVIRQMPSKEALEIAKALERLDGLLIRDKA
jgi:flagellar protein FlaG